MKPTLVQKFGGTSLADVDRIRAAARRAVEAQRRGQQVVVVVSAMAKETDRLLGLAQSFGGRGDGREWDVAAATGESLSAALMALAIQSEGAKARSFLGFQLPILTDENPTAARILSVQTRALLGSFNRGEIPVVAGFQGVDRRGRVTTLGRGGSDTTAVAIAAALGGVACDIYTDVDGVYSADPRICPQATRLDSVSYRFMIEAAGLGAKVMHDRSVILGMRHQVPIRVKSSFVTEETGTEIGNSRVLGNCVTLDRQVAQVSLLHEAPVEQLAEQLTRHAIPFTMLSQTSRAQKSLVTPTHAVEGLVRQFPGRVLFADEAVAKVSLVGALAASPAYQVPRLLDLLQKQGIACGGLSQGPLSLSLLLRSSQAVEAVQLVHPLCSGFQEVG